MRDLLKKLFPHIDSSPGVTTTLGQRRRFMSKLLLGLLAFSGLVLFLMTKTSPPPRPKTQIKGKTIDIRPMVEQIDVDRETWILQSSQRMKRMENEISVLQQQLLKLQQQTQSLQESQQTLEKTVMKLPFKMDSIANSYALKSPTSQKVGSSKPAPMTQPTVQGAFAQPTLVPTTQFNQGNRIRIYNTSYADASTMPTANSDSNPGSPVQGASSSPPPVPAPEPSQIRTLSSSVPKADTLSYYTIPSGSFAQGVILSGAYAPSLTGGNAGGGAGPYPVLIEIVDPYILPSLKRGGLKHAFVIASAYGDLSSERAILRLERISFIYEDGSTLDQEIKGWVVGPDGMYGIPGKVVSREGSLIARAILAGMLSGVSGALEQAGRVIQQTPLGGTMSYIPPENVGKVATYSGLGKAAEMLANFYIQRANQLFPVVEVPAGTEVTLVLLEPLKVKLLDASLRRSTSWE